MRRILLIGLILALGACTPPENEGGTPLPGQGSSAPLNDEAIGPSEEPEEIEPSSGYVASRASHQDRTIASSSGRRASTSSASARRA
jgi:hypothetical protein